MAEGWFILLDQKQGLKFCFQDYVEVEAIAPPKPPVEEMKAVALFAQPKHKMEDYVLFKVLGKGAYGKVFLAGNLLSFMFFWFFWTVKVTEPVLSLSRFTKARSMIS